MSIKDAMHAANEEMTHPGARELFIETSRDIDAHNDESWQAAFTHAAVMVRNGWDIETAAISAGDKFGLPYRAIRVLMMVETEAFGQVGS